MKNVAAVFVLLVACSTGIVKAQKSSRNLKSINDKQLVALNFIDNISVTHEVNVAFPVTTAANYSESGLTTVTPLSGIIAEQAETSIERISAIQFKYAMMMDVEVETVANNALFTFIDDWYGTQYRLGGTTKKGIDCSAFTGLLLSAVYSYDMPRTAREQYNICEPVNKEDLVTGDLVFFNTCGGVSHVGVYLGDNHFVHSSSTNGVAINSLDDCYYSKKFIGGGRVKQ